MRIPSAHQSTALLWPCGVDFFQKYFTIFVAEVILSEIFPGYLLRRVILNSLFVFNCLVAALQRRILSEIFQAVHQQIPHMAERDESVM